MISVVATSSDAADLRGMLLFPGAAEVALLGRVIVDGVLFERRRVDHGDQRHAEVDAQAVDAEETEECHQRDHHSARRELYTTVATRHTIRLAAWCSG